ncbi:MAG: carbohydrate-binding domain-containing protein [Christensenellales bacterium]|jgi:hypothetical protein
MKRKNFLRLGALMAVCVVAAAGFAGCLANAGKAGATSLASQANEEPSSSAIPEFSAQFQSDDLDASWDDASATVVSLTGADITISGGGATADGSVLRITKAGTYVVSGTLADGQIQIAASDADTVRLVLNGADITNRTGAAIYASRCGKLVLILADGTDNTLTDGGDSYQYTDSAGEEPNAALFCKDDLTINGNGALTVNAGFHNGVTSKDDLLIVSGNLTVIAANHGLRGNDSVTVLGGALHITAGNDGIQTNNTEDAGKGYILIEDGSVAIVSAHDGMQADQALAINGGEFEITAGGGASSSAVVSSDTASDSFKGIKSAGSIQMTGGHFVIDSYDDSLHANSSIAIGGGELILRTGDDAVHADGDLTVSGGKITVEQSYEGLEASNIHIADGTIDIVSSDDGLNAAGGSDANGGGGRFGQDNFYGGGNYSIHIAGGQITLFAGGDGIDSNGTITVSGGTVLSLIDSRGNGAMDCDGAFTLTGGTVIYGGSEAGSTPGADSTQSYVYVTGVPAGSEITVKNNGTTLLAFTPPVDLQTLALSSPDIVSGESYEVYSGENLLASVTAGTGGGGMGGMGGMGPGAGGGTRPGGGMQPGGVQPDEMQPGEMQPGNRRGGN